MAKLTPKQQRFVDEYLIDLNATQAAIRAMYSPQTANEQGARLLANVSVQNAISRAQAERSRRTGINQDRIVLELAKIALLNISDVVSLDDATIRDGATREDTACVASIKVKKVPSDAGDIITREVKVYDKVKALDLLGRHLGMFTGQAGQDIEDMDKARGEVFDGDKDEDA